MVSMQKTDLNVNNGRKIIFWEENWLGTGSLKLMFPDVHQLNQQLMSTLHEGMIWAWVERHLQKIDPWLGVGEIGWILWNTWSVRRLQGRRRLSNGSAKARVTPLLALHIEIWIRWNPKLNFLPWKLIWKIKIPSKVTVFTWLVVKEVVLTRENIMKRGIQLCPRCCFCEQFAQTISHVFLHCKVEGHLWNLFMSFKGIGWTVPENIGSALESWNLEGNGSTDKSSWRIVPTVI